MSTATLIILIAGGILAGFGGGFFVRHLILQARMRAAGHEAESILTDAKRQAETLFKETELKAKESLFQARTRFEEETREERKELTTWEKRIQQKEELIDRRMDTQEKKELELVQREKSVSGQQRAVAEKEKEADALVAQQRERLESISGMTADQAKEELKNAMLDEARFDAVKLAKRIEEEAKENADKKAKEIVSLAVQRCAADYVVEHAVTVVNLPNEEMKGRIIGREGRNIRSFESVTGVDLIVDDTPEAVILSAFDPVKRVIARISLERLVVDGRIHPARIEEVVKKVAKEVETQMKEEGEKAAFDVGVHGIHPEIIRLLGRLRYRTSYAQNVLAHSLEVAWLCGIMAGELGLPVKEAKRVGLLHDIGKAVDHEVEGSHALIGADLAKKYGESQKVVNAIAAHHDEVKGGSLEAILVQAADALSAARPGARREMLETYVKRLADLEAIANSYKGVQQSYAIQAGREVRIMVESKDVSDDQAAVIAREVAGRIEKELAYPGQIRVTVIRETRAVEVAK